MEGAAVHRVHDSHPLSLWTIGRSGAWTNSGTGINSNGLDDTRGCYQEALSIFVKLSHGDNKYAGAVARVEASLQEVDQKGHCQWGRQQ